MSGFNRDGYQPVEQTMNPMWDPCQKKDAQGNTTVLVPTDKSWIAGYYLGMKTIKGKDGSDIKIHDIQLQAVGDPNHISEAVEIGNHVSLWGKTALDENLVKNVMIGTSVVVEWKGKKKSQNGREYHVFDVLANPNDVLTGVPATPVPDQYKASTDVQSNYVPPTDESDLPF